jgi:hypothetical protein
MDVMQTSTKTKVSEFLRGRVEGLWPLVWGIVWRAQRLAQSIRMALFNTFTQPDDDSPRSPDAGKPSPLMPSPTHRLMAAKGLPPSDETYLLPKD